LHQIVLDTELANIKPNGDHVTLHVVHPAEMQGLSYEITPNLKVPIV